MNTKLKILASAVVVLFIACGNSQKGTTGTTEANGLAETDGTSDTYYSRDPATNDRIVGNTYNSNDNAVGQDPNHSQQDPNASQEDYDKQRNEQMYSSLKMTDDQIQKYENTSRSSMDAWKQDNPNTTMSAQDRVKFQNDNLKPILDESQFQTYGQWSTSNPYKN